jgi:[ribosomal protein S18]-alanine N-acetyltransferase
VTAGVHGPGHAIRLRAAGPEDLDAVLAIERVSFADPRWTRATFASALAAPHLRFVVAEELATGGVAGYIVTSLVVDEAEIMNLAVAPAWRARGIGATLVDDAIAHATGSGAAVLYLEVRESNAGARALYHTRGFDVVGRRRGYYSNPAEDALLLERRPGGELSRHDDDGEESDGAGDPQG